MHTDSSLTPSPESTSRFELRLFQQEALTALLEPGHLLCIAPTGSGKSLIYERAASEAGSRILLVTPLVALARQQYRRLVQAGVRSKLGAGGNSERPDRHTQAWIVSPEMLRYDSYRTVLARWNPTLLVVDECHCLWDWGQDFRPAFESVPKLITEYGIERSLWLTATLPQEARNQLRTLIPSPLREQGRFGLPPELRLTVLRADLRLRCEALLDWTAQQTGDGILFVATREQATRLTRLLAAAGRRVSAYHAGLSREERQVIETRIRTQQVGTIVATSAFGMGMDYSHLRWVALWQAPPSLLAMTQAIGRVGRGVTEGHALVLWDYEDLRLMEWTALGSDRRKNELRRVLGFLSAPGCRKQALHQYYEETALRVQNACNCDFCVLYPN